MTQAASFSTATLHRKTTVFPGNVKSRRTGVCEGVPQSTISLFLAFGYNNHGVTLHSGWQSRLVEGNVNSRFRGSTFITLLLLAAVMFLTYNLLSRSGEPNVVPISRVAAEVQADRVERIVVSGNRLEVRLKTGQQLRSTKEATATVAEQLKWLGVSEEQLAKVQIEVAETPDWTALLSTGGTFLMMILFLVTIFFSCASSRGSTTRPFPLAKAGPGSTPAISPQ